MKKYFFILLPALLMGNFLTAQSPMSSSKSATSPGNHTEDKDEKPTNQTDKTIQPNATTLSNKKSDSSVSQDPNAKDGIISEDKKNIPVTISDKKNPK